MRLYKALSILFILTVSAGKAAAQVYSPTASDSFAAVYNLPGGTDKVFVYNRPEYKGVQIASIMAYSTDRQTGWDFQWAVWDGVAGSYSALPGSDSGWFSGIDTISLSSGYQVTISKGLETHVYRVWLVFNDFRVGITNKDEDNKIQFGFYNCSSLDLRADTTLVQGYYFDPDSLDRFNIFNSYTIRWKTDNPEASVPASRLITRVNSPPSEDTWYFLTVTDRFNLARTDSIFYESIQSDADLAGTYVDLSDSIEYPDKLYEFFYNKGNSSANRSAPGKYRFDITGSKNSVSYKFDFGDGEFLETDTVSKSIVHEFKTPGTFTVILTTRSGKPYECADTATYEAILDYGSFALPHAFSPDNSGQNDFIGGSNDMFRSEDVSVVTIDIVIFNRAGIKMHAYSGNIRDWEGWDGNVMSSNREAPEGVYFYVISALFYYKDPVKEPIKRNVYSGFFHLYR